MTLPPMTKNFFAPTTRIKSVKTVMYLINISLTFLLVNRWLISGHFPLSNLYESLIFLSWSFSTIYSITSFTLRGEAKTTLLPIISWSVAPVTLLTCAYAFFCVPQELQKAESLVPALQSNWLIMHVSVMILSYASLILGSLFAFSLLLIVHFELPFSNWLNSIYMTQSNQSKLTDVAYQVRQVHASSIGLRPTFGQVVVTTKGTEDLLESANPKKGHSTSEGKPQSIDLFQKTQSIDLTESRFRLGRFLLTNLTFGRFVLPSIAGIVLPSDNTMAVAKIHPRDEFSITKSHSNTESLIYQNKETQQIGQNTLIVIKNNNFLDNLSYRFIGLGFALLTLGIISGAVWANSAWGSYWSWDPKETWAFITWLTYAIYLHLRISKGWYGKQSAFVALFGFFVVWFCYLGVNLFGKGLHSYAFV